MARNNTAAVKAPDFICRLLAGLSMMLFTTEIAYTFLAALVPRMIACAIPMICFAIGYIIEGAVLHFAGYHASDDPSYEGSRHYIRWDLALIPLSLSFIGAMLSVGAYRSLCYMLLQNGLLLYFDEYSLQPTVLAIVTFAASLTGIIIQFYPYTRIASLRVIVASVPIALLCTIYSPDSFPALLFCIYCVCTIILMNQGYITRICRNITVTRITLSARMINLRIILLCTAVAAISGVLVFIILNGLYRIILFIFYLAVYRTLQALRNIDHERIIDASDYVFGGGGNVVIEQVNRGSLVGAVAIIAIIMAVVIGGRPVIMRVVSAISALLERFSSLFMGSYSYESEKSVNFRDTEYKIERIKQSRTQAALSRSAKLTLRDFNGELAAMKTDEEKLSYSYIVMVRLLSELNSTLRASDTPRELAGKINASQSISAIDEITTLIEKIKYAESAADPVMTRRVLVAVRDVVEKHLV